MKLQRQFKGGSTAVVALLIARNQELWVGNVGDSRCVLAVKSYLYGSGMKIQINYLIFFLSEDDSKWYNAIRLSRDFKPTDKDEKKRILETGGTVSTGRVGKCYCRVNITFVI